MKITEKQLRSVFIEWRRDAYCAPDTFLKHKAVKKLSDKKYGKLAANQFKSLLR